MRTVAPQVSYHRAEVHSGDWSPCFSVEARDQVGALMAPLHHAASVRPRPLQARHQATMRLEFSATFSRETLTFFFN